MSIVSPFTSVPLTLQGAAGQSTVIAAQGAGIKIYVVGYAVSLDAAGTLKFQSNNTDLTGAMSVGTVPAHVFPNAPMFATAANEALKITTATGKAAGFVLYYTGA